ncbi:photosynthetic reaction center cytochrome PufC [Amorphus orientalis]|uniref:Photosynthetic reaction center cytochrome c subunit n=1 Tax=Amorphus orientalis TaxID=649198 RepID=A0AAE3VNS9_9HYPH|nr:photosynthetic reaction center cytochrome PufC [Amorphus orientalis]MDQ0315473.1 photosynthetic reaction center cytochrome c subunit [Amorphus orientalis]
MKLALALVGVVFGTLLFIAMMLTWERPPMDAVQLGYRGTGMDQIINPRTAERVVAENQAPEPQPEMPAEGQTAGEVYENVQVLGDLPDPQFIRLMTAITEWVSPEESCGYCHNYENLASDEKYPKVVARRMLQMNMHINTAFTDHVAQTGVTCYTCHRGQPVPSEVWFTDPGPRQAGGMAALRQGQNLASDSVGDTSLPYDPLTDLIGYAQEIRVVSNTALPQGQDTSIQATEKTYGLMMHMSNALGVNCTFCHNSQSFSSWTNSTPQRVTAFHGIQMVRNIDQEYLESLKGILPDNRLGPTGDVPMVSCATCHRGQSKPLNGVSMLKDYPSLAASPSTTADNSSGSSMTQEAPASDTAGGGAASSPSSAPADETSPAN